MTDLGGMTRSLTEGRLGALFGFAGGMALALLDLFVLFEAWVDTFAVVAVLVAISAGLIAVKRSRRLGAGLLVGTLLTYAVFLVLIVAWVASVEPS